MIFWCCYWCKKCCIVLPGLSNEGQIHESNGAQTTFKWTIDGFSSLLDKGNGWTYSSVFQIRGLNWYNYHATVLFHLLTQRAVMNKTHSHLFCRLFFSLDLFYRYLKLNPRDTKSGDQTEYVSLKLELAKPSVKSGTVVEASFKFLIYDQSYGKHHEEHQGTLTNYSWRIKLSICPSQLLAY